MVANMLALNRLCTSTRCGIDSRRCFRAIFAQKIRNPRVLGSSGRVLFCQKRALSVSAISVEKEVVETPFVAATAKDLPKNFDAQASEESIYQWWEKCGYFEPNLDATGDPFVISMPPPNVTGKLHMGHAMFVTLEDIMIRFARMRGQSALWLPGTDHAGIATQMVVEKLLAEEGTNRHELGREKFEQRVWDWKTEYGGFITGQLRRLGASCDWSRERFTLDEGLSRAVAEAFVRLHEKGLIYKGSYMVNWAPKLQTAVSDLEVEYSEEQGTLYYFKYPLADSDDFLPVATTRPETILGDTAVAVHPLDERYKHLIDRECIVPMSDRRIQIVGDEYVDMEFGTGALKITPGHDPNDYEIGKRLDLEFINIMNKDATMNGNAGKYAGLDRFDARKQLWTDMDASGLVIKKEPYLTRVPRSQRGGEVIEPLISDQWFVKMEGLAKPALDAVSSGEINIMPDRFEKIFNHWLEDIKDWCISRQLWWGHRIPVWYVRPKSDEGNGSEQYVVARDETEAMEKAVAEYGPDIELEQEVDVLDTWFSSGLWPFSTLGWPDESSADYQKFYPTQMMETGHDILFFWVARMIMMGIEFTGKAPFSTVYLHGLVRDEKGKKMSKSLGNVVDPLDTIAQYGTDPLRFTLATGTSVGYDLNLSLDRVTNSRNFSNKLWNIGKFIGSNLPDDASELDSLSKADFSSADAMSKLSMVEKWAVSRLHQVTDRVTRLQEKYDLAEAGRQLYDFVWGDFADWYVEAAKTRLYSDNKEVAQQTREVLVYCYDKILKLLHPYMPFITEELWQAMPHRGDALIVAEWPAVNAGMDADSLAQFGTLQAVVRSVRNARAEYGVELGRKVPATISVADGHVRLKLESEIAVLNLLGKLDTDNVKVVGPEDAGSSEDTVELVVKDGVEVFLPMSGLFDPVKELDRLQKQVGKVEKQLAGLEARLNNESFVSKAPKDLVEGVRKQKSEVEQQKSQLEEKMSQMKALMN